MTTYVRRLAVGSLLCLVLGAGPTSAQCAAFSSVTFQSYGSSCASVPSCSGSSLYGFYGSCNVSLALFGPTFVAVALGSHTNQGIPVGLSGMTCSLWIGPPYFILDLTGQGLSQVVYTPPPVSLAGITVFCQVLYTVNCGGGPQLGLTDALMVTFN